MTVPAFWKLILFSPDEQVAEIPRGLICDMFGLYDDGPGVPRASSIFSYRCEVLIYVPNL